MIGYLEGELIKKYDRRCLIKSGPVGYSVFIGNSALGKLQENSGIVKIFTHLHVREDVQNLYGFLTEEELELFEMLLTVSGIGPKSALTLTDEIPFGVLVGAIRQGEEAVFKRVSGIGQKTAQRIIIDLKSKILPLVASLGSVSIDASEDADILEALKSLGYSAYQAREALKNIPRDVKGVEKRIEETLKILTK